MSILSKIVLGFVFLASLAMFYVSMRTLKTHAVWREAHQKHDAELERVKKSTETLVEGTDGSKSLAQLRADLHRAITARGRVWQRVLPQFDPNTQTAKVTVDQPEPHQIQPDLLLYVFDMPQQGGPRYLGEFKAVGVQGKDVALQPTHPLRADELQDLMRRRGPWTLYEVMPADGHDVFVGLDGKPLADNQVLAFLPRPPQRDPNETDEDYQQRVIEYQNVVREYVKDGKPAEAGDPAERIRVVLRFAKNYDQLDAAARRVLEGLKIPPEVVREGQVLEFDKETADQFLQLEIAQEVERKYRRRLRDYGYFFRELARQLPLLQDRVIAANKDLELVNAALKEAQAQETFTNQQITETREELGRTEDERAVVQGYQQFLEQKLATARTLIDRLHQENNRLAHQLAERQAQLVQQASSAGATASAGR